MKSMGQDFDLMRRVIRLRGRRSRRDWKPQYIEIKKWLLDQWLTQRQIAREAGVSPCCVSLVIQGKKKSRYVREVLCWYGCPRRFLSPSPQPSPPQAGTPGATGGEGDKERKR